MCKDSKGDTGRNIFIQPALGVWNALPGNVAEAGSVEVVDLDKSGVQEGKDRRLALGNDAQMDSRCSRDGPNSLQLQHRTSVTRDTSMDTESPSLQLTSDEMCIRD
eukprot:g14642.t1